MLKANFFGLMPTDLWTLAFQLAKRYNLPHRFNKNIYIRMAAKIWYYRFIKDNFCLSLLVPKPTSIARPKGFNKEPVDDFFDKYKSLLDEYRFTAR